MREKEMSGADFIQHVFLFKAVGSSAVVLNDLLLSCFIKQVHMLPPLSYSLLSLLFSLSPLHVCPSYFVPRLPLLSPFSCLLLCPPLLVSPWLRVDISISLLAVVVGFCGLALLVVSLFVFWKLCWPIWRSKALSAHAENGLHVGFPEAPPPNAPPITECKAPEVEKKRPAEVKVGGRSTVKLLEAAMKISQTSPDIPAEVQTALREKLTQQAKIQRQTTEPTSSSRYMTPCRATGTIHLLTSQCNDSRSEPFSLFS